MVFTSNWGTSMVKQMRVLRVFKEKMELTRETQKEECCLSFVMKGNYVWLMLIQECCLWFKKTDNLNLK